MTRTQTEALTTCTSLAEVLAHSPERNPPLVREAPAAGDNAGLQEDETASQHGRDADLLETFRCPISKVSKKYASYIHTPRCTASWRQSSVT